ncbi:hypothetical protein IC232_11135 [Microvirga sp. BT688]|uniref:hypothetical protein n=1 Tax=Microvirga sp. TaxID=1873136 RepID=UPI0016883515|nr:hypothetical protein [Microvirga sp.]MBD2747247.1 hypothetical protein [Microvirga sp.]
MGFRTPPTRPSPSAIGLDWRIQTEARTLLKNLPLLAADVTTLRVIANSSGGSPSIDGPPAVMERAYGLPLGAAFTLFAIGRTAEGAGAIEPIRPLLQAKLPHSAIAAG